MPAKKQSKKTTKVLDLKAKTKSASNKGGAASLQAPGAMRSPSAFGNPPGTRLS